MPSSVDEKVANLLQTARNKHILKFCFVESKECKVSKKMARETQVCLFKKCQRDRYTNFVYIIVTDKILWTGKSATAETSAKMKKLTQKRNSYTAKTLWDLRL